MKPYVAALVVGVLFLAWSIFCYWLGRRSVLRYEEPRFDSVEFSDERPEHRGGW
jgi:hypothetical protein